MADSTLLDFENISDDRLKSLILPQVNSETAAKDIIPAKNIIPQPGFCLKTKTSKQEKVFINICSCDAIPQPLELSDDEIIKLAESTDASSNYRMPMSIGEPHAELDNNGKGCTAYDVVINPKFLQSVIARPVLMSFFLSVVIEGVGQKYSLELDQNWIMLQNRKFVGTLPEQSVRTTSKPLIAEMDSSENTMYEEIKRKNIKSEAAAKKRAPEPPYTITQEPAVGYPEFLVAEFHLPQVKTASTLALDVGEDRIRLETRSNVYYLDIYLPFNIVQEECGAQFNVQTKILTLTMPVVPAKSV